jgi:ribosomal-protein-alanine N-acetyltransferase
VSRSAGPALPLPDPPLVDEELSLRAWDPADAEALASAWVDPDVVCWTGVPEAHDLAAARRWIDGDLARRQRGLSLDLVIEVGDAVVGEVGLAAFDPRAGQAEIGWWLVGQQRGQGLATRAVQIVSAWALGELCLERLVAACHPDNPASGAVARRAGFAGPTLGPEGIEVYHLPGTISA